MSKKRVYSELRDKTFQAYKDWITAVAEGLGIPDTMTEEEWHQSWTEFWSGEITEKAEDASD